MKKMVSQKMYDILSDLDGVSLEKAKEILDSFVSEAPASACNFRLALEYGYDEAGELSVVYDRPETDKEYDLRIEKEKKEKELNKAKEAKRKEKELKELERLKKKYENES